MGDDLEDALADLTRIELQVCSQCLAGAGGECHSPGCSFWIWPGPTGEWLEWLQSRARWTFEDDANREATGE